MSQKQQHYEQEFKSKIVRLHIEEGRTYKSLTAEYGVSKASISKWCSEFSEECQQKALSNPDAQNNLELMKENNRLRKELEEARKENLFLKKAVAFFAKEIDERLIDSLMKIRLIWEFAGFSDGLIDTLILITTT